MRLAILWLTLAALARPQDPVTERDPAGLFPHGTPIYVELEGLSAAGDAIKDTPVLSILQAATRERVDGFLSDLAEIKVGRAAIGVLPALIFSTRWIVLAETSEPQVLLAKLVKRKNDPGWKPATAEMPPFFVIADSTDTIETVAALRDGKEKGLSERDDFKRFRARTPKGVVRWHVDVKKLAPNAVRFGLSKNDDAGAVLFGHHLMHIAKTARTFSGSLALAAGAALTATAEIDPVPPSHAFTETRPTQPVLLPPNGGAFRLSLPRDLRQFWNDRATLLSQSARAPLAEFQNNLSVLMGGLSVEDVFAGLGAAFDLYVARGDPAATDGHRYPSAAIVAVVSDPALKAELILSFQTTVGIVNAQRATDGMPRLFQDSARHRDVLIASARILPESVPDRTDDRLQVEWSLAMVKDRLIIGTNRSIVASLVDRALDDHAEPRVPGEEAELFGPKAATLVLDASALVRSQMELKNGRSKEEAQKAVDVIAAVLSKIDHARARLDLEGELATLEIKVDAERLLQKATESR